MEGPVLRRPVYTCHFTGRRVSLACLCRNHLTDCAGYIYLLNAFELTPTYNIIHNTTYTTQSLTDILSMISHEEIAKYATITINICKCLLVYYHIYPIAGQTRMTYALSHSMLLPTGQNNGGCGCTYLFYQSQKTYKLC